MVAELVVGVTGRRHIVPDAIPAIESASRSVMRALNDAAERRGATVWVCSGLAVGADTIAARAVLEEKGNNPASRLRLRAVLPMPREDYRDDFAADELAEFESLLTRCDDVVETPRKVDASGAWNRVAQYSALRDYLVANSDVLLAYWSGDASVVKPGGTVDVVLSVARKFFAGRAGLVFSVATPELKRIKNPDGSKTYVPESVARPGAQSLALFGAAENFPIPDVWNALTTRTDVGNHSDA